MRPAIVLVLVLAAGDARASGSVSLDVADELCSLTVEQTFRKILDADDIGPYIEEVRKAFAGHAALVLPEVSRVLKGSMPFDLALPLVTCREDDCPDLADARFPAVVRLQPIRFGDDARQQYIIGVAFARKPTLAQLGALRAKLRSAIALVKDAAAAEPLDVSPLPPVEVEAPSFLVRVRPYLWARGQARLRHEKRLTALAAGARTRLDGIFAALPAGLEAARCTKDMPYYEDNKKKLPGKLSRSQDGEQDWRNVTFCLKKIGGDEALGALHDQIDGVLADPLATSPPRTSP